MSSPDLTATDIAAVNHVLATRYLSLGPQLEAFEEGGAGVGGAALAIAVKGATTTVRRPDATFFVHMTNPQWDRNPTSAGPGHITFTTQQTLAGQMDGGT